MATPAGNSACVEHFSQPKSVCLLPFERTAAITCERFLFVKMSAIVEP
jgi:hypothetical protein